MVILVFGVCPNLDLEVCRLIWCILAKIRKLKVWKVERFDRELTLGISGSDCDSDSLNISFMSFGTCIHNFTSFRVYLIWFGASCKSCKFISSLSSIWGVIHSFDIVWCDLRSRVGPRYVMELVGMFGQGPGGPECVSDGFRIIWIILREAGLGKDLVWSHLQTTGCMCVDRRRGGEGAQKRNKTGWGRPQKRMYGRICATAKANSKRKSAFPITEATLAKVEYFCRSG